MALKDFIGSQEFCQNQLTPFLSKDELEFKIKLKQIEERKKG